jgi:RimJ/RimL family protein N-acetyltransferase
MTRIRTTHLDLVSKSKADVRAMIDAMSEYERAQMSAAWLALLEASSDSDPWVHGFSALRRDDEAVIGTGGFTGPPSKGVVEIAYGVGEEFRSKGYATEIAQGLVAFCFASTDVEIVRAHALPDGKASQRILEKCGFDHAGEIVDPVDGRVWRYEKHRRNSGDRAGDVTIVSAG